MNSRHIFLSLFLLIIFMPSLTSAQTEFENRITNYLSNNESTNLQQAIAENRYQVPPVFLHLLNSALKEKFKDEKISNEQLNHAEKLALLYREIHHSNVLLDQVNQAKKWSPEETRVKLNADSLRDQGIQLAIKGKLDSAVVTWENTLQLFKKLDWKAGIAGVLYNIGKGYRSLGKYPPASEYLTSAAELASSLDDKRLEANSLRESGVVAYITGSQQQALDYWQKALAESQQARAKEIEGVILNHIGIHYKNKGKLKKALEYYDKSLDIAMETGDDSERANILNNMGNIYLDYLADYDKASRYFQQALEIKRKQGESVFEANILGNIGICHKNKGDYFQALRYFSDAVDLAKKLNIQPAAGKNLSDIGTIYTELGDYEKATPYYNEALVIFQRCNEKKHEIETLTNLAVNYGRAGEDEQALTYYRQALELARQINWEKDEEAIIENLAAFYAEKENIAEALKYFNEASAINKKVNNVRGECRVNIGFGDVYFGQNEFDRALERYKAGLKIALLISATEQTWQAYFGLAKTYQKLGNYPKALQNYERAIITIEDTRTRLKLPALRESYMQEKIPVYEAIISLLLQLGRDSDAYEYLERSKARSLLDILNIGPIQITEGITPALLEKKKDIEWRLFQIQQDILKEYSMDIGKMDRDRITNLEDSLKQVRQQHEELLQEIRLNHPAYAKLTGTAEPLNLSQVQEKILIPGTTLIEYFIDEHNTYAWVVQKKSFVTVKLNKERDDLEEKIKNLVQPFRDIKEGKVRNFADVSFDVVLAQQLYQQIFMPIEQYLQKDSQVIIIPDGMLHYLPFEALVTTMENKRYDRNVLFSRYKNAHYLVEKYAISYSPSASVLDCDKQRHQTNLKTNEKLLGFGNPDFGRAKQAVTDEKENNWRSFLTLLLRSSRGYMFNELPKSEEEVKSIAKIMKPSVVYFKQDAKEEYFKQQAGEYPFVHLATHCIVDETQPMYSRIVFAQDDDPAEDGFLHTYEVFNLNLNADLVTLSACETGLGTLRQGEGIVGLTRAFMYAGTPSVLVSLWSVDESTSELMKLFYSNLKTCLTKTEALRQAKISLLKAEGKFTDGQKFSFAHPFLWAPFVLVGIGK